MTDETAEPDSEVLPWSPDTDPDGYTYDDVTPKDWYLDTVLNFVHGFSDESEGVIGLTVQSAGATISGLAISRGEWIRLMVDVYNRAGATETGGFIETLFTQAHDDVAATAKERDEADLPTRVRGSLHMKDVRIGEGTTYTQVPLWRGKLADITGWSLGSWNPPVSAQDN